MTTSTLQARDFRVMQDFEPGESDSNRRTYKNILLGRCPLLER